MAIKIEKGVPLPPERQRYSFAQMEVGDSFVAPHRRAISAARSWAKLHGSNVKFVCRTQPDGTFRIWRVA